MHFLNAYSSMENMHVPVTIMVRMLASLSSCMICVDSGFNMFSIISSPRNSSSLSMVSLGMKNTNLIQTEKLETLKTLRVHKFEMVCRYRQDLIEKNELP